MNNSGLRNIVVQLEMPKSLSPIVSWINEEIERRQKEMALIYVMTALYTPTYLSGISGNNAKPLQHLRCSASKYNRRSL